MLISSIILKILVWTLYIFDFCYTKRVNPIKYISYESPLQKYGSSQSGHCSNTSVTMDGGQVCTTPQSSVLFDKVIPSLTERNNNMRWASQLLVLNLSTTITFEFSDPSSGITSFGIVMLNCPQENIGGATKFILQFGGHTVNKPINHMSCDHLIRVCVIFPPTITNTFTISFEVSSAAQFPLAFYCAEISFYDSTSDCRLSGIIDTPTSSTTSRFQDLEPEHNTEINLPITSGTPNMKMSEPDTTNNLTSKTSNSSPSTSPKCDMQSCLIKKSNNAPLIAAVIVLSVIAAILTTAVIIIPLIIIMIYKRKLSDAVSSRVIYDSPDNIKEESFHMTQSSVYEIHSINK